jgi:hypothetical protein
VIDSEPRRSTVVVVQIANPFNKSIDLTNYEISVCGQKIQLANPGDSPDLRLLQPALDGRPTTAVFYAIKDGYLEDDPVVPPELEGKWLDFLDLQGGSSDNLPAYTIVRNVNTLTVGTQWAVNDRTNYDSPPNDEAVSLSRIDDSTGTIYSIVIDRIDPPGDPEFANAIAAMGDVDTKPPDIPVPSLYDIPVDFVPYGLDPGPVIDLGPSTDEFSHWVQWVRATRAWGVDVNGDEFYGQGESNPRYVFGNFAIVKPGPNTSTDGSFVAGNDPDEGGSKYAYAADPDPLTPTSTKKSEWFNRDYFTCLVPVYDPPQVPPPALAQHERKPFFFDLGLNDFDRLANHPDKGWYSQGDSVDDDPTFDVDSADFEPIRISWPMQMLQKDRDFELVGELLNVWMFGHRLETNNALPVAYVRTLQTFSEFMTNEPADDLNAKLVGADVFVNRLRTRPTDTDEDGTLEINGDSGLMLCVSVTGALDPRNAFPALPAGVRLLDAFVCDGPGINPGGEGSYLLAKGFDGSGTPGQINVNTAPPEVMRSIPMWYRMVHETGETTDDPPLPLFNACVYQGVVQPLVTDGVDPGALLPRVMVPEALVHYRERFNGWFHPPNGVGPLNQTGIRGGANYERRATLLSTLTDQALRVDRGMASPAEVNLLISPGQGPLSWNTPPPLGMPPGTVDGFIIRPTATPGVHDVIANQYWKADYGITPGSGYGRRKPFQDAPPNSAPPLPRPHQVSMRISTDRDGPEDRDGNNVPDHIDIANGAVDNNGNGILDQFENRPFVPTFADTVAGDAEEANLLYTGASNIITTRSDTFTVYFKVRSFRQNTSVSPARWDATDPDYIVDESRYVMLVDRSTVNRPGDKPKIVYLEKLPN